MTFMLFIYFTQEPDFLLYKSQNRTNTSNTFEAMDSLPWLSLFCLCLSIFPLLASSALLFQVFYQHRSHITQRTHFINNLNQLRMYII